MFSQGGSAITTQALGDAGLLLSRTYSGSSALAGLALINGCDSLLRRASLAVQQSGSPIIQQAFGYDLASRLLYATNGSASAGYNYLANTPLVSQISFTNGSVWMATVKQYDNLGRLLQISTVDSAQGTLDSHAYAYNIVNQRTNVINADGSYWNYQYDPLGQVTSGLKSWSDGTAVAGEQFQYQFDTIGNRTGTDTGGDQNGANLHHANYTAGVLNQYSARDVPGYVQSLGTASSSAQVALWTANSEYAQTVRKGAFFRGELPAANTAGSMWVTLTNAAALANSPPVLATNSGSLFVAQTPEQFTYDADGNLAGDGRWTYAWDAENRLVTMTAWTAAGPQQLIKFAYDWQGRRIQKQVWNNTAGNGSPALSVLFVYDGWNPVATLNALNAPTTLYQSYLWGLDLSGSAQGAGGVGGLLSIWDLTNGTHFIAYDGNGNVSSLVNASSGAVSAQYEYGPFGETIRATGPMAKSNPFRFSTRYQDDETDMVYYGYRYYSASMGRWLNRDFLGEKGGPDLYTFTSNAPVSQVDVNGLIVGGSIGSRPNPMPIWNCTSSCGKQNLLDLAACTVAAVGITAVICVINPPACAAAAAIAARAYAACLAAAEAKYAVCLANCVRAGSPPPFPIGPYPGL
jgi:RHS repeat-associated protein